MSQSGANNNSGGSGGTDLHVARFIVSAGGATDGANYTTIAAAITAAALAGQPQTIFIQPGTYPEDLILQPGINLCAFDCDATSAATIIHGKCTFTQAGTVSISGITLDTNSDYYLSITGTAASIVYLFSCNLSSSSHDGINITSTGSPAEINALSCVVNTSASRKSWEQTNGVLTFYNCNFNGASTTASTSSGGTLFLFGCLPINPVTTSSTSGITISGCIWDCSANNVTCLTIGGSGANYIVDSAFKSGTASTLSIGSAATVSNITIDSTNTNAITGSGTLSYTEIAFTNTSSTINSTVTLIPLVVKIGTLDTGAAFQVLFEDSGGITGDGTNYTMGSQGNSIVVYDTAGAWDIATFTYTIPIKGVWSMNALFEFFGIESGQGLLFTVISTSTFFGSPGIVLSINPAACQPTGGGDLSISLDGQSLYNAGDTVQLMFEVSGGTKSITNDGIYLSGTLLKAIP